MKRQVEDLTGKRFGKLTVIKKTIKNVNQKTKGQYWLCKCDCGNKYKVNGYHLRHNQVKSCGCLHPGSPARNLVGQKFGRLLVLSRGDKTPTTLKGIFVFWNCICDCGKKITVRGCSLKNGTTKSCGCLNKESVSNRHWKGCNGLSLTYFNKIKSGALHRGIPFDLKIEDVWDKFQLQNGKCAISGVDLVILGKGSGLDKFGYRHTASLDRIKNDIGYCKNNIQWVHKSVNRMKCTLSDNEFLSWNAIIYKYQQTKILKKIKND